MKNILLKRLASGEFVSGAEIADSLGVSRNAVWKVVQSLRNDGFIIDSVTSKGYRISPENNKLSAELISHDGRIIVLDETDSTNNYAKTLASQGAEAGTVVLAESQNAGKGRLGRTFVSPKEKGLYMSVIVRPGFALEFAPLITSAVSVAVAESVETLSGCPAQIKWVNDVYMNGKKICGILTEASLGLEYNTLDYAVVGIGINVLSHDFGELSYRITSIQQETGKVISRNRLCGTVLKNISLRIAQIESKAYLNDYRRREILTGNMISANVGGESICGKALGIDDNANLIVQTDDGIRTLASGEANLIRMENFMNE
ncbi:MAG: biotin--[acetyl-CoA-carboxylase] ligase [Ruminococcus flavefaciens]|nr:biotin--[acetyl-CoA-carboxylase] ligase [Ruminococcus flavefaciens]MCM1228611.1 biotin--[acetyl-CoA-carboxylase] ligase [Ruminococcus flavefaciens]